MLAWVVLLSTLSFLVFLKRHFGLGFAYGIVALFSLNGQFHFPVSNGPIFFHSCSYWLEHSLQFSGKTKNRFD